MPDLLAVVHLLIERKTGQQFILTGSSARKLRRPGVNLLGGRAAQKHIHPYLAAELGKRFSMVMRSSRSSSRFGMGMAVTMGLFRAPGLGWFVSEPRCSFALRHLDGVTQFLVSGESSSEHRARDRVVVVEIVEDQRSAFGLMPPVKSAGVLHEPPFERKRHRQHQSIQTREVEPLADQRRRRE
jgi:hypothetical protein